MSLAVAIQSVVFYVVACTTCHEFEHHRQVRKQADKDRKERDELETKQPGIYRHPLPYGTNPYWAEEIALGPNLPKRKADRNRGMNESQKALNGDGGGSSYAGSTAMGSEVPSTPTTMATGKGRKSEDSHWNMKRYQREDEPLWGLDYQWPGQKIIGAIKGAGTSAARLWEEHISRREDGSRDDDSDGYYGPAPFYQRGRNPPVNDLHPPVVSAMPATRQEAAWMLQPPPCARIMEGKVRVVNRSRAGTAASNNGGWDANPKQVAQVLGADLNTVDGILYPLPKALRADERWKRPKPLEVGDRCRSPSLTRYSLESSDGSSLNKSDMPMKRTRKSVSS